MIKFYVEEVNNQTVSKTYLSLVKKVIKTCVESEYPNHKFEVEITFCDDKYIHQLNKQYRNIDKATDVLSFPMLEFSLPEIYVSLGNIVISVETARRQAKEYGHSFKRELCFLAAHSAFHLLGYDHIDENERAEMEDKQNHVLDSLNITR